MLMKRLFVQLPCQFLINNYEVVLTANPSIYLCLLEGLLSVEQDRILKFHHWIFPRSPVENFFVLESFDPMLSNILTGTEFYQTSSKMGQMRSNNVKFIQLSFKYWSASKLHWSENSLERLFLCRGTKFINLIDGSNSRINSWVITPLDTIIEHSLFRLNHSTASNVFPNVSK